MKERPILFSAPMVRAILAGSKTQTRRAVKGNALNWLNDVGFTPEFVAMPENHQCPYGQPGDRLWVREAFSGPRCEEEFPPRSWYEADNIWYWADGNPDAGDWTRPRPSIHMPRWASRILLEITAVRVERLQAISETDALAEGVIEGNGDFSGCFSVPGTQAMSGTTAKECYARLWDQINGAGSWAANPWVWVVEFRRVTP